MDVIRGISRARRYPKKTWLLNTLWVFYNFWLLRKFTSWPEHIIYMGTWQFPKVMVPQSFFKCFMHPKSHRSGCFHPMSLGGLRSFNLWHVPLLQRRPMTDTCSNRRTSSLPKDMVVKRWLAVGKIPTDQTERTTSNYIIRGPVCLFI